ENGQAYWFAYFWEECGGTDFLAPCKDALARLFEHLFVLPAKWDTTLPNSKVQVAGGSGKVVAKTVKPAVNMARDVFRQDSEGLQLKTPTAWDNANAGDLLTVMEQLLATGFVRIEATGPVLAPTGPDTSLDLFRCSLTRDLPGAQYILGWRGDGRKVSQINDS